MFELCQAPTVERYLHDLLQYALGVLQIVTLVPSSQKMIVNATLSTNQSGIYVILDAANISNSHVDPEIIQSALNVLITLVCPLLQSAINHLHCHKASSLRLPKPLMVLSLRLEIDMPTDLLKVPAILILGTLCRPCHTAEQGYHQAREAVCSSNGIKVLIQIISSRVCSSPGALDCLRALACRVLLGLARDDNIPHTLTKLQVWFRIMFHSVFCVGCRDGNGRFLNFKANTE